MVKKYRKNINQQESKSQSMNRNLLTIVFNLLSMKVKQATEVQFLRLMVLMQVKSNFKWPLIMAAKRLLQVQSH